MQFGLVRRGYSKTGGAEAYLKRLAASLEQMDHGVTIFGSPEWPPGERPAGSFVSVAGRTPAQFAAELERFHPTENCDVLYSLERVRSCDFYRAGDGVHASWLQRRKILEPWWKPVWRTFDSKHRQLLDLENRMLHSEQFRGVIANSNLVAGELKQYHGIPASQVHVVYNGLPQSEFCYLPEMREDARKRLRLAPNDIAVAFVGTGWGRKGLNWAMEAVELCGRKTRSPLRLIVAGRGSSRGMTDSRTTFLGPIKPVKPLLMGADIFILPTVYDPFSNATLEAFACGLPVVTTRANGFSEVMESPLDGAVVENGWDVQGLTSALERLLPLAHDEEARYQRVKRASRFTMDRNLMETLAVLTGDSNKAPQTDSTVESVSANAILATG